MSATIADLKAKISVDGAEKAKKDLADLKGSGGSSGHGILGLADGFKSGLGAVTGFITGFEGFKLAGDALGFVKDQFADILAQGSSQQAVMAQTAAVIKSTGGAAHISADQVGDLADKLARLTGTSDDTIQSAENILLTFTNINKNIFPQTTGLVLDLATAMHEDLNSAAIQIGKALNDPIQGVTALRRVGVQLTDQQAKMVAQFVKTGQTGKAQAVIIKELTKEVGGSAEAYGKTFPGMAARFNVALDQAKEKIGLAVIPILEKLLNRYVMPLADWLGAHLPAAIDVLTGFLDHQLMPAIDGLMNSPVVKTIEGWALAIVNKFIPSVDDKSGMAHHTNVAKSAVKTLDGQMDTTTKTMVGPYVARIQKTLDKVDAFTNAVGPENDPNAGATGAVKRLNDKLSEADKRLDDYSKKQKQANQQGQQSIPVLSGLGDAWGQVWQKIQQAGDAIGGFVDDVKQRFPAAQPLINQILGGIGQSFADFLPGLQNMWEGFWAYISMPVRLAFEAIHTIVNLGLDILGKQWGRLGPDLQTGLGKMKDVAVDGLTGLLKFVAGVGQTLLNLLALPFRLLWSVAEPLLNDFAAKFMSWYRQHIPQIPGLTDPTHPIFGGGSSGNTKRRASGGPISGPFIGAEMGMELLVTPGLYNAPPGSYVYNNAQTRAMLSGNGGRMGGNTYNIYPQQATIDTRQLARIQQRQDLLNRMRG